MKKLTIRQVAQLKRTAQNVYPLVSKKNKLIEQMNLLNAEIISINAQIDAWEYATKEMTEGFTSEDLITRKVICLTNEDGTPKVDKNGQQMKVTKYEPKEDVLSFNEEENVYEIISNNEEPSSMEPSSIEFEESETPTL